MEAFILLEKTTVPIFKFSPPTNLSSSNLSVDNIDSKNFWYCTRALVPDPEKNFIFKVLPVPNASINNQIGLQVQTNYGTPFVPVNKHENIGSRRAVKVLFR